MHHNRRPRAERKSNNVLLILNDEQRAALESGVDRHKVEIQTYLRTLIVAADRGELPINSTLFER